MFSLFLTLNRYHWKLEPSSENFSRIFSFAAIVFKRQNKLGNAFHFKDRIPKELASGVVYEFQCGHCNESYYAECVSRLNVRIREHIKTPLNKNKFKYVSVKLKLDLHDC